MKARSDFILRNIAGEYMLMPTGKQIRDFQGMLLMNELSAFVWEKMQTPISREKLLTEILSVYETDEQTAAADLDTLLENLLQLGVIET